MLLKWLSKQPGGRTQYPLALRYCDRGGRVILLGSTQKRINSINFYTDIHRNGLTIIGAHQRVRPEHESYPGHWTQWDDCELILRLIARCRIDPGLLLTHEFSIDHGPAAYQLIRDCPNSLCVLLRWNEPTSGSTGS